MERKLLHTPEGVRDIYNDECAKKLVLQNNIHQVLSLYGYHDIQTPTFEFFDIFNKERGSVASSAMYKFFDRDGNTLVLRPDMTPSVARSAAKYFMDESMPLRFCYMGNTFINNTSYQGRLKEMTQIGAELIGDDSSDADAEVIAMIIDSLLKSGLQEFQVEIGQVDFFKGLLEESGMTEETEELLRELIENKNYFGVEELLSTQKMSAELKEVFLKLPELFGSTEIMERAETLTTNKRALKAIDRLKKLYKILENYGFEKYVSFDLGMLSLYQYYTGIIFKAYTYGTGDAIVTGGRYDNLLKQFGKDAPSIGFAISVDYLMSALERQKIEIPLPKPNTMILYESRQQKAAIRLAQHFRETMVNIELVRKSSRKEVTEYTEFAKRNKIGGILYLENSEIIQVINCSDNSVQTVKLDVLIGE